MPKSHRQPMAMARAPLCRVWCPGASDRPAMRLEAPPALPVPLERLVVPAGLDGRAGTNRAPPSATHHLGAEHDLAAVHAWLAEFRDSPHTARAYRKEAERLLLWALVEGGKPL